MDYTVGSLSDLITGTVTPNKPKVVKKKLKVPKRHAEDMPVLNNNSLEEKAELSMTKKVTKKRKLSNSSYTQDMPVLTNNLVEKVEPLVTKKVTKKRKLGNNTYSGPSVKKNRNNENAERRVTQKMKPLKQKEPPEILSRTIFVGNLPINVNNKNLKSIFTKYGKIESVRVRGVSVANPNISKKVAMIKGEFHPDRKSLYGYVKFEEREDAIKATEMNRMLYEDHHLKVSVCDVKDEPDDSKAIFIGNLSFYAEDEDLWKVFECCGPIASVRIVRDGKTGIGLGFGYVNFESSDSVSLALEMENVLLKGRELRIGPYNTNAGKKGRKNKDARKIVGSGKPKNVKKNKNDENKGYNETPQEYKRSGNMKVPGKMKQDHERHNKPDVKSNGKIFQGVKFTDKKKRKKVNKGLLQKKKNIQKVAPK